MFDTTLTSAAPATAPATAAATLTRERIVEELKLRCSIPRREAKVLIDQVFDAMVCALRTGDTIQIRGLGTLKSRARRARLSRNPQTGITILVPQKRVIVFKPSRQITHGQPDQAQV